jgi:hypothetical protein
MPPAKKPVRKPRPSRLTVKEAESTKRVMTNVIKRFFEDEYAKSPSRRRGYNKRKLEDITRDELKNLNIKNAAIFAIIFPVISGLVIHLIKRLWDRYLPPSYLPVYSLNPELAKMGASIDSGFLPYIKQFIKNNPSCSSAVANVLSKYLPIGTPAVQLGAITIIEMIEGSPKPVKIHKEDKIQIREIIGSCITKSARNSRTRSSSRYYSVENINDTPVPKPSRRPSSLKYSNRSSKRYDETPGPSNEYPPNKPDVEKNILRKVLNFLTPM